MASVSEITDEHIRTSMSAAEAALDSGDFASSVHHCVAAYCRLIDLRPDMIVASRFGHSFTPPQLGQSGPTGGGLIQGGPRPWPSDHGVRFTTNEQGQPQLTFAKDRFTLSEAATYFEYTLDMVMRAQRRPAPVE